MPPRTVATFDAAFPDDAEWDEHGNLLIPGGRAVTEALHDALVAIGSHCTPVVQHSFYGWKFDIECKGTRFTYIVQSFENDQWLLICNPRIRALRRLFSQPSDDIIAPGSTTMHTVLTSNNCFSNVRWYNREQFEKGGGTGAATPT